MSAIPRASLPPLPRAKGSGVRKRPSSYDPDGDTEQMPPPVPPPPPRASLPVPRANLPVKLPRRRRPPPIPAPKVAVRTLAAAPAPSKPRRVVSRLKKIRSDVSTLVGLPVLRPVSPPRDAAPPSRPLGPSPFGPDTAEVDLSPYMRSSLVHTAKDWWRDAAALERRFMLGAAGIGLIVGIVLAIASAQGPGESFASKSYKPTLAAPSAPDVEPAPAPRPTLVAPERETADMTFETPVEQAAPTPNRAERRRARRRARRQRARRRRARRARRARQLARNQYTP